MIKFNLSCPYKVDYFNYYRSETIFTHDTKPVITETIPHDTIEYIDRVALSNTQYYIAIGAVKNGIEKISDVQLIKSITSLYRYYRIYITSIVKDGDYIAIHEIEFALDDGLDITTPTTKIYTSSSYDAAYNQNKIIDNITNDVNNLWISGSTSLPQYITIDFDVPTVVNTLRIWPQQDISVANTRSPKDFIIQGSNDNINWQNIKSFSNITDWTLNSKTFIF